MSKTKATNRLECTEQRPIQSTSSLLLETDRTRRGVMDLLVFTLTACLCFRGLHAQITEYKRFPSLSRRVDNCTAGCYYCPSAWKRSWVKGAPENRTATSIAATVFETLNEKGEVIQASTKFATLDQPSTAADGVQVGVEGTNTV